ncbi:uncharacterized protein LOC143445298 isoform X2 [Clavelina lepadiformis]|uniref:uncharacterized protein LOC143445298 isoform X2 n=1 Tax=Clavelina lepadiformis TaxID=159417 RepID=UPI00404254B3
MVDIVKLPNVYGNSFVDCGILARSPIVTKFSLPEMEEQTKKSTSSMTTQSSHSSQLGKDLIHSSVSSLETDNITSDMVKDEDSSNEHDLQWKASAATSPTGSLKSAKKKKGGYQHLPSDSDEEGKKGSTEDSDGVEIKITDLSPEKPLSRWAPIPNDVDDIGGSSGDVSAHNSLDDDPLPGDLDDDIFAHDNRLSADISGLKGFNRADKGSQNNLVDFSVSAEKFNTSRAGSICSSEDDPELETVFDMTAQGDSLKRKRKKKVLDISADDQTTLSTPTYQIGIANDTLHSSSTAENSEASCFEVPAVKNDVKSESANTSRNPFWRSSPLGDTVSLASNTSESNPFDRIQFHSAATATPAPASSKSSSGIPALPPPPTSTKSRNLSGSSRRTRTRESPKESLVYDTQTLVSRESANTKTTFKPDCAKDDLIQHSVAGTSSESTTELDGISLLDLNKCDEKDDKETNLKPDVHADEYLLHSGADSQPETEPVSVPGTSQKDSTILETTLSILDVFSKPPLDEQSSINTNIKTYPVLQSPTVFPDLRENSLNSITKLQKPVESPSLESPQEIAKHLNAKKIQFLKEEDIISNNTEWNMLMRFPRQKHLMSSRKWVKIFIRLKQDKVTYPTLELYHTSSSKDPFYFVELARQDWQLTEPVLQARFQTNDNVQGMEPGVRKKKVHAVKILRVYYKEKHAFGSAQDKYLTRIPVGFKHSVKGKQEVKLGTENYSELLSLILAVKNASFNANKRLALVKDVANINDDEHKSLMMYHSRDEIVFDLRDECRAVVSANGEVEACSLMVHVNVTSFLSGDPMATVTFNDIKVESREVVRRDDIIPSSNDKWVEINDVSVHRCSNAGYDDQSASITFYPPDSCRFELARLTCPHREPGLPVIIRASVQVIGCQVKLRCVLRSNIDHSANRSTLTQVPCEDMSLRFPIPDNWVPAFRRNGRLHMKSVHSKRIVKRPPTTLASNRSDAVVTSAVMEASVGSAKYEVAHGAVVWKLKRFPEKNAAQNSPRVFSCALQLASDRDLPNADVIDDVKRKFCWCEVEYTMVSNTASSVCVRSVHLPNTDRAEKFTCYSAHYFYKVGISVNHEREDGRGCTVQ